MDAIYVILTVIAGLALLYILWCLAEPFFLDMDKAVLKKSPRKDASINNIVINSGVKINCEPIINSNIYHTAPLDMTFMEMSSEIISINGMLYNVIGGNCSDDKFRFNLTMKPTRMVGNPIIK